MAGKSKSNEIKIVRVYEAPVKAVWDAWTDPQQVGKWWGPRGFTLTTHKKDLRVGGTWEYTMHGPDGTDYPNRTTYFEVEKHARLVYDHGANDKQPALFRVTVNFSEAKGRTTMDMTMALSTAEQAQETKKFIKKAGGNATWDRLAEHLSAEGDHREKFFINRSFEAPIQLVFDMFVKPEHFSQWLPPIGLTMEFIRADIRAGGAGFYQMKGEGGAEIFGRIFYREITAPSRIVYDQQFCDKNENVIRHPMAPAWPETMHTIITLAEEEAGTTRVTVEWMPEAKASVAELAAFVKEKGGMTQGWTGSFDKLEEYLAKH